MTAPRVGIIFLFFVYLFTPIRIIQGFILLFLSVVILDKIYLKLISSGIRIIRQDTSLRGFCGIAFNVELYLENRSFFPIIGAVLFDPTSALVSSDITRRFISVPGRKRIRFLYKIRGRDRGIYELGPASIRLRSFFGGTEKKITDCRRCPVIIFPSLTNALYSPLIGSPQGTIHSSNPINEDTTRYRAIRDYVMGDELKRINWKIVAKTGKLVTNSYENLIEAPLILLLDLRLQKYKLKSRYVMTETAISIAATLTVSAISVGQPTGIHIYGILHEEDNSLYIPPVSGSALPILDCLSRVQAAETQTALSNDPFFYRILTSPYKASVVYLGPRDLEGSLTREKVAKQKGGSYLQYVADLTPEDDRIFLEQGIQTKNMEQYELR